MHKLLLSTLIWILGGLLVGCRAANPDEGAITRPAATPAKIQTATTIPCQTQFEGRELAEPYQRHQSGEPRLVLTETDLDTYLAQMGIVDICIPPELGAPFLNADWNSAEMPATGRMISLGFENTYSGAGWSAVYLLYSTYDFSAGTAFDRFAHPEDWLALQAGGQTNRIATHDVPGFVRYQAGLSLGDTPIYQAYIFPSESGYVAVVVEVGIYPFDADIEVEIAALEAGNMPETLPVAPEIIQRLVSSIQFNQD